MHLFIASCARTHLLSQGSRLGIEFAIVVERLELTLQEREALNVHGGAHVILMWSFRSVTAPPPHNLTTRTWPQGRPLHCFFFGCILCTLPAVAPG